MNRKADTQSRVRFFAKPNPCRDKTHRTAYEKRNGVQLHHRRASDFGVVGWPSPVSLLASHWWMGCWVALSRLTSRFLLVDGLLGGLLPSPFLPLTWGWVDGWGLTTDHDMKNWLIYFLIFTSHGTTFAESVTVVRGGQFDERVAGCVQNRGTAGCGTALVFCQFFHPRQANCDGRACGHVFLRECEMDGFFGR